MSCAIKKKPPFNNKLLSYLFFLCLCSPGSFAQSEEEDIPKESEAKTVLVKAVVPPVPIGITLADALKGFPQEIEFRYQHDTKQFQTETRPFTIDSPLNNEINITLKENSGLSHEEEAEGTKLTPVVKVGEKTLKNADDFDQWSEAGKRPKSVEIQLPTDSEQAPPLGKYNGQIVLLFEEVD